MNRKFAYRALDQNKNKIAKGIIQAVNEFALEQILLESNLVLISFREIKVSNLSFSFLNKINFLKLKVPLLEKIIIAKIEMLKFIKFFGVRFVSGIPILECLSISGDVVKNTVLKTDIKRVKQEVSGERSVSTALSESPYFSSMVLRTFKVGEDSGNMTEAMKNIQYFYSSEINDSIDKVIGTIQPTTMFIISGLMTWVVVSVFGYICGNFDNFGI